jgi:hypothetical protein
MTSHASRGTRRYAAIVGEYAGARGRAAKAGWGRGVNTKRRLRRSRRTRPNICLFNILRRLMCPSTGPLDHASVTPALTAA